MRARGSTSVILSVLLFLISLPVFARPSPEDIERRINDMLARMTLEEKLGQLQQLDGEANGEFRPEHRDLIRKGLLGSTLNVRGVARVNELQHIALDESRMKIPVLFAFDVIYGYRTVFPMSLAQASSWDPSVAERAAAIAASEATAVGLRWTFSPMVDIARDPRWGRIMEGAGEDPYLGSAMARAYVRGFQGTDLSDPRRVVACAKHFVGYGAAEGGRDYNTVDMSDITLRQVYLPPFKAALDAGVGTFMSAFDDLNGVPASANPLTLTKILRGEWKFDGFVVSDYTSVMELINQGLAADEPTAARAALNAGVDMEMVSRLYNKYGAQLLALGQVSNATIDEAVRRILRVKFRLGLFEHPYASPERERTELLTPANRAAAREIAGRSMVLLKNDRDTLPLNKTLRSIAVIGPLADDQKDMIGWWKGDGRPEDVVSLLSGIKSKVSGSTRVGYARGCDITGDSTDGFAEAVNLARESDVAIVAVGESAEMSGEAASRASLDLPGRQMDLVKAIQATGKPTVVVLMNGRPLTINWATENVPAILEAWLSGTEGGNAIADILFGDVNPGGKLPVTWPRSVGQIPIYYNHMNTGRPPEANNRYSSKYYDMPWTPLYPFGFGLSYSRFRLSNLQLSAHSIRPDGRVTVGVEVENTSRRPGDEVVQLYIRDVAASVTQPVRELKGFERVHLRAGERRRLQFQLTPALLGFYNRDLRFVVEPGQFKVMAGTDSTGGLEDSFQVVER